MGVQGMGVWGYMVGGYRDRGLWWGVQGMGVHGTGVQRYGFIGVQVYGGHKV